ncbi:hypothetical protein HanXRQr2_Chr15g0720741 [Helianthus annuus]|uniref:Uncharacterized protein n=1 Tax=Helianthus annuus TaxID=4232 RepID=A0A9K3E4M1_HELAN|nr:hypothetical protein HanXRQr2_Chr15g0720741 [Helianthus annuus]KAJ0833514.1 hypothetical protein HanPSC8_Chr15g0691241 [Helianthus annuus]
MVWDLKGICPKRVLVLVSVLIQPLRHTGMQRLIGRNILKIRRFLYRHIYND